MSSQLSILFICGLYIIEVVAFDGETQICGYNGDSLICCSGYKKDDQGECIIPICEHDCGIGGKCIRPDTCYCSNGRVSNSCSDDNRQENDGSERRKDTPEACTDNCNGQGVCVSGRCQCHMGYSGASCLVKQVGQCFVALSRGICQKSVINLRANIEVCCSAFNVAWGDPCQKCPKKRCQKGFIELDGICQDVNECSIMGLCSNGNCQNLVGSYKCLCAMGFQFDPRTGDCVIVKDMCQQMPSVCGSGMKCIALSAEKYRCQCLDGYTLTTNKGSCEPQKDSALNFCAVYGKYVCQFGKCKSDGENYKCDCEPGYKSSGDGKSCKKSVDYCALYQNMLCPNGECVSSDDGDNYMCKCDSGYTQSLNRKKCTSVCDLYPTSLCPNGRCIPLSEGGYECQCNDGYSAIGKGKECRRIMNDQSASSTNMNPNSDYKVSDETDYCSYDYYKKQCQGGRCINKRGHYQCDCLNDFTSDKNGLACKKIEKSVPGQMHDMAVSIELKSYCDKYGSYVCTNGHCVESGSSYQCQCNSGYKVSSDGKSCYDVNECALTSNVCGEGTCTNSPGSYQCSCYDGFTIHYLPGGPKCYDRNECEEDQSLCNNGQCLNKWGSYSCSCNNGYVISSDSKQCLLVKSSTGVKGRLDGVECRDCLRSCKKVNATYHKCSCPEGLDAVLNTGLCAPMSRVIDLQFEIPVSSLATKKIPIDNGKHILFQLIPGSDQDLFIAQVTSQRRSTVVEICQKVNEPGKDGILCSFHNDSSNKD